MITINYSINQYDSMGECLEQGITIWVNDNTGIKFQDFIEFAEFVGILDFLSESIREEWQMQDNDYI
ncbi:hypothetical protein [Metabacillus litoralis]|uniref:hypothetical protein n=1 Tax=Metabacillus litoralis TaxID=152268 RepID=UPI00203DE709|nr:hypothetical protein [Metabacillus litoralis]MCM3412669.1 hypothetical protein [Metabacillus litoralis]